MKKTILALYALGVILLTSCGGSNGIDFSTKEGVVELKKQAVEKFGGDKEVFYIYLMGENELSSDLMLMTARYVEDGKSYEQSISMGKLSEPELETSFAYDESKDSKVKLSDFNFDIIPQKFEEAVKLLNSKTDELEGFKLYTWTARMKKDNKMEASFVVNATKKGEGTQLKGRSIETTYYGFNFEMKADGTIEYKE